MAFPKEIFVTEFPYADEGGLHVSETIEKVITLEGENEIIARYVLAEVGTHTPASFNPLQAVK
jgi:hypothetical protein